MTDPTLTAFQLETAPMVEIVTADRSREWMDATSDRFANRCLPMMIANQAGWWLLNPAEFSALWTGQAGKEAIMFKFPELTDDQPRAAESHFGHGIITFRIPYLFRTSPDWLLMAKGPANYPKDGLCALEGITETDWAVATFTMNWKITAKNRIVNFAKDEPFCHLMPIRRGDLERFDPEIRPLASAPELQQSYRDWSADRKAWNAALHVPDSYAIAGKWQRHYMRGTSPPGDSAGAGQHQTNLKLKPFRREN